MLCVGMCCLFDACCCMTLADVRHVLFVVYCVLIVVCHVLVCVVFCLLYAVCRLLAVV